MTVEAMQEQAATRTSGFGGAVLGSSCIREFASELVSQGGMVTKCAELASEIAAWVVCDAVNEAADGVVAR